MRKRDYAVAIALVIVALLAIPGTRELVAQTSYSVQGWLAHVTDETNDSLQISIVSTDTDQTIGGNLSVTGTSTLTGAVTTTAGATIGTDLTVTDDLIVGGWYSSPPIYVAAQSYTVSSASKAGIYYVEYTDTDVADFTLPETPTDGTEIGICDGELNADSNNITVYPQGTDTILETTSFVVNAAGECQIFKYFETNTNWHPIAGYGE